MTTEVEQRLSELANKSKLTFDAISEETKIEWKVLSDLSDQVIKNFKVKVVVEPSIKDKTREIDIFFMFASPLINKEGIP
jgi:hypothetical protein